MSDSPQITISPLLLLALCLLFACSLIIHLTLKLKREKKQKKAIEEKHSDLERKVGLLELESIKYKLNPHLFKNALNAIQSHAYQTYYSLDKLSNVLDFILYESERQFVSVKEELDFALSLIEINRIKLSPLFDLRIKNKVPEYKTFYNQEVLAPLITVDLIENAFKHANLQGKDAFISIVFELTDDNFSLTVSNKIDLRSKPRTSRSGFGKQSLQKRLEVIYGENFKLDQFTEDDIYISHLTINLLEHKAKMLAVG